MKTKQPHHFTYKYSEGPLPLYELSRAKFVSGNCRRAIQDYLYFVHGLYLNPKQILLPEGYLKTGSFITRNGAFDITLYKPGDILYAERIRGKNNKPIQLNRNCFETENEWIVTLHSAIFISKNSVYHATAVTGKTCVWDLKTFGTYYKPIAVKRVLKD